MLEVSPAGKPGGGLARSDQAAAVPVGAPPSEGDLVPVAHGWLLRRASDLSPWALMPAGKRARVKALAVLPPALPWLLSPWIPHVAWLDRRPLHFAPYVVVVGSLLLAGLSDVVVRRFLAWSARRGLALPTTHGLPAGKLVRIRGVVRSDGTFDAALSHRPAVLARYRDSTRSFPRGDETRGIDFCVELEGGTETVKIDARESFLADEPSGRYAYPVEGLTTLKPKPYGGLLMFPVYCLLVPFNMIEAVGALIGSGLGWLINRSDSFCAESVIGPGDLVDVVGVLDREVSLSGETLSVRGAPVRPVLRAGASLPLLVRRVPAAR